MDDSSGKENQTDGTGAEIETLRRRIDDIDDRVLELINQRLEAAREIGRIKKNSGTEVVDSRRESEIYLRLLARNTGSLKIAAGIAGGKLLRRQSIAPVVQQGRKGLCRRLVYEPAAT